MKTKLLKNKTIGNQSYKVNQITLDEDEENFTLDDVKDVLKTFEKQKKSDKDKVMIRGLNGMNWVLLKALNKNLFTEKEIDDYLEAQVQDAQKFKEFSQLEVSIIKN
jgi:hypothetical protein